VVATTTIAGDISIMNFYVFSACLVGFVVAFYDIYAKYSLLHDDRLLLIGLQISMVVAAGKFKFKHFRFVASRNCFIEERMIHKPSHFGFNQKCIRFMPLRK